jgi:hypothetical protein
LCQGGPDTGRVLQATQTCRRGYEADIPSALETTDYLTLEEIATAIQNPQSAVNSFVYALGIDQTILNLVNLDPQYWRNVANNQRCGGVLGIQEFGDPLCNYLLTNTQLNEEGNLDPLPRIGVAAPGPSAVVLALITPQAAPVVLPAVTTFATNVFVQVTTAITSTVLGERIVNGTQRVAPFVNNPAFDVANTLTCTGTSYFNYQLGQFVCAAGDIATVGSTVFESVHIPTSTIRLVDQQVSEALATNVPVSLGTARYLQDPNGSTEDFIAGTLVVNTLRANGVDIPDSSITSNIETALTNFSPNDELIIDAHGYLGEHGVYIEIGGFSYSPTAFARTLAYENLPSGCTIRFNSCYTGVSDENPSFVQQFSQSLVNLGVRDVHVIGPEGIFWIYPDGTTLVENMNGELLPDGQGFVNFINGQQIP